MGKALVIPGVNFETNKLTTVTIEGNNPCTGITLSDNSKALEGIGTTYQLTATVTPADTTDNVVWTSSDTDIAIVVGGLVTVKGIGTCDIVAMCGTQSDSCEVTTTAEIDANTELTFQNAYYAANMDLTTTPPKDLVQAASSDRFRLYYSGTNTLAGYKAFSNYNNMVPFASSAFPVEIPYGTKQIKLVFPSAFTSCQFALLDSQTGTTFYASEPNTQGAKLIAKNPGTVNSGTYIVDLTGMSGYDSFVFSFGVQTGSQAESVTGDVAITFS